MAIVIMNKTNLFFAQIHVSQADLLPLLYNAQLQHSHSEDSESYTFTALVQYRLILVFP